MPATVISLPSLVGFNAKSFTLGHAQQVTPIGQGGFIQTIERAMPFWTAKLTTPPVQGNRLDALIAFLDSLDGSVNPFYVWDPSRPMPSAYASQAVGSDPWTQAAHASPTVIAQDYTNSQLTIGVLANGAVISNGDYISIQMGNAWYLFRVVTGATAAGNQAIVTVKPRPLMLGFVTGTAIKYRQAGCAMKMIGPYTEDAKVGQFASYTLNCVQYIERT